MSERDHNLTPAEDRARAAVRALAEPAADPAFVTGLRSRFVAGSVPAAQNPTPRAGRQAAPGRRLGQWATVLLATAAIVLLGVNLANRGPAWSVVDLSGTDHVLVDGARVDAGAELAGHLRAGRIVEVPAGGRLEIVAGGSLMLQLNDEVAVTLPRTPGRWFQREVRGKVDGEGVVRITTGPDFPGSRLQLNTDAADLDVTGTTLAVIYHAKTACICVLEGSVAACPPGEDVRKPVTSGHRMTFYQGGTSTSTGDMLAREREELTRLREHASELFRR